jgi:hypothetical protein
MSETYECTSRCFPQNCYELCHSSEYGSACANNVLYRFTFLLQLSSPTTYEISAPIPSQLAYSEHKITYQPQQNAIQYTPQEYNQKLANPKQAIARLTVNYQPYPQQFLVPQPIVYQQPQQLQQIPVYQQGFHQPIPFQGPQYQNQGYQPLIRLVQAQPGITYAGDVEQAHQRPAQRELKTGQPEAVQAAEERAKAQPQLQEVNI